MLLGPFLITSEAVVRKCSVKKVLKKLSKISQNLQENTCARFSFLLKLHAWVCNFIKKRPAQVFSCEFWEIFKSTFFHRIPPVAGSYSLSHHLQKKKKKKIRYQMYQIATITQKSFTDVLSHTLKFPRQLLWFVLF